jgi:hypothetical protein
MDSDKERESTLTPTAQEAIGDAARANVNAAVEVAKSAVGSFVGALTGERKKSSTTRRGARRKKAASKGAASKRGKTKRSAGGKRSTAPKAVQLTSFDGFAEQEQAEDDFARRLSALNHERISVVHMQPNYMVNRPACLVSGTRRRRSSRL